VNMQPAYMVAYVDAENPPLHMPIDFPRGAQVVVRSASLEGNFHYGAPKTMSYDKLPTFMFQLIDAGYVIEPHIIYAFPGIKAFNAFSPEFVDKSRQRAAATES